MSVCGIIALSIVACLCTAGVFYPAFRDNWLQFVGLTMLTLWSVARVWGIVVRDDPVSGPQLFAHIGLAAFAVGTAFNYWKSRRTKKTSGLAAGERNREGAT